jgi:hypothetical protein
MSQKQHCLGRSFRQLVNKLRLVVPSLETWMKQRGVDWEVAAAAAAAAPLVICEMQW